MNILIYGAGILGSLYAVRLEEAGQDVSILVRENADWPTSTSTVSC